MPEPRGSPKFLPRLRKNISVTFGAPIDPSHFNDVLEPWRNRALHGSEGDVPLGHETEEKKQVRIALTDIIQREIENLGRTVSGPSLGRPHIQ